jgi:hypothetical protein
MGIPSNKKGTETCLKQIQPSPNVRPFQDGSDQKPSSQRVGEPGNSMVYPLVNVYITMERSTIFNGKLHYKWPFSIAMLVYQRVAKRNQT